MYYKYVEMHKAVNLKKTGINKDAVGIEGRQKREKATMTHVPSVKLRVGPQCGKQCGT